MSFLDFCDRNPITAMVLGLALLSAVVEVVRAAFKHGEGKDQ